MRVSWKQHCDKLNVFSGMKRCFKEGEISAGRTLDYCEVKVCFV